MGIHSRTRGQAGFSLLEVLVSLVIMSVGMLSLAQLQASLIRSSADAKSQTLAMAIAKLKIEKLASVQSLGGTDAACVSPSDWMLGQTSCYRAVTDEGAEDVDGDPILPGTQPLGGVEFEVSTEVTRYVFDVSTSLFDTIDDVALDSTFVTSAPETFLPGKEFKRILVTVAWDEPDGSPRQVQVEDVLNGVVPRDSIALLTNRRGNAGRRAEAIINDPGTVPGVVPVAVGDESRTAASNPAPELLGGKNNSYVSETRFDVLSYVPLDAGAARAQSRVETAVVGCRCDTATASTIDASLRPTYWNGTEYVVPTIATYAPIAGPKAPVGQELPQSDQCRVCCRDHHDPPGDDANGDPKSAIALFSPRRASHDHYLVNATTGLRTLANTGPYDEVCRMIRINGIFRVAADLHDDYFALLPARNAGVSAFAPSPEVAGDYSDMVKRYLDARIVSESDSDRYNDSPNAPTPAGPDPSAFETGTRTLDDGFTTRSYDLNLPADYFLKLSADSKWLHARGLYIDFLTPEAIARIDAAKVACPTQPATAECVLPYLPFTTINLSELAEWKDEPITPSGAASGAVLSVINNGFRTATGDESYVENGATGLAGSQTISFAAQISGRIVPGMTVAGSGLADGARVVTVANSSVTVDKPHATDIATSVTFEGAPVRGLALPGTATSSGYAAYARAIASYNNAAIALKFPMHPDEGVLGDQQRFQISADGAPPDPTAGVFTVAGFLNASGQVHPFGTPYPVVEWGIGASGGFSINTCTRQGTPLPYLCAPSSGLGGPMRIRISGYNVRVTKSEPFTGNCAKPSGGVVSVSGTTTRPYCKNYDITEASTPAMAATTPFIVNNPGKGNESTEIGFAILNNNDPISIGINEIDETAGTFVSCTTNGSGTTLNSVTWSEPCL